MNKKALEQLDRLIQEKEKARQKLDRRKLKNPVVKGQVIASKLEEVRDRLETMLEKNWSGTQIFEAVNKAGINIKHPSTLRKHLERMFPLLYAEKLGRVRAAYNKAPSDKLINSPAAAPVETRQKKRFISPAESARIKAEFKDANLTDIEILVDLMLSYNEVIRERTLDKHKGNRTELLEKTTLRNLEALFDPIIIRNKEEREAFYSGMERAEKYFNSITVDSNDINEKLEKLFETVRKHYERETSNK